MKYNETIKACIASAAIYEEACKEKWSTMSFFQWSVVMYRYQIDIYGVNIPHLLVRWKAKRENVSSMK